MVNLQREFYSNKKKYKAFLAHIAFLYLIFSFFFSSFIIAQNITTIAGTGTAGYNGDGIAATTAQLFYPQGLAVDAAGNIYITDLGGIVFAKLI